jgi:hypothetical protein
MRERAPQKGAREGRAVSGRVRLQRDCLDGYLEVRGKLLDLLGGGL